MTRNEFREAVFIRDQFSCVVCGAPAVDAHHLIERRLWPDGGYYIDNGVSLCEPDHLDAERTLLSVSELRYIAGINKIILPETLETGHEYDKWGNVILYDGKRMIGPLFYDESVQSILPDEVKVLFTQYVKYPRTPYLPWTIGLTDENLLMFDPSIWNGIEVVVTEKMDGENITMYCDGIHARSIDSGYHATRTWVKNFHANIAHDIPKGYRIAGENMYAKHSIQYDNLSSFFLGIGIWNGATCLSWDETTEWFDLLGIHSVPVLARGTWPIDLPILNEDKQEGYVIRVASEFSLPNFGNSVAKYVRPDHIQTSSHWIHNKIELNCLT